MQREKQMMLFSGALLHKKLHRRKSDILVNDLRMKRSRALIPDMTSLPLPLIFLLGFIHVIIRSIHQR